MASFDFDQIDQIPAAAGDNKINFLKLADNGWYAKVRFMYGEGENFGGQTVHNVSEDPRKPRWVPCLRGLNDPLETCPLCKAGSKISMQFFVPLYVISIVSNVRGVQQEEPVNQVMLFQKGTTFKGTIASVIRQAGMQQKPIVSCVFNLVRNGAANDQKTTYSAELVSVDNTSLEQLPPRPQILGSYILPDITAEEMQAKYVDKTVSTATTNTNQMPAGVTPRTINTNTFAGNTVVTGGQTYTAPTQTFNQPLGPNQVSPQAPTITNTNVPF